MQAAFRFTVLGDRGNRMGSVRQRQRRRFQLVPDERVRPVLTRERGGRHHRADLFYQGADGRDMTR
ncbi:MAG: hypothetical protein M3076_04685 [Actinomycetota bacterium]|nr:hypothetical protein [Actinomycetota bacterium]